MNRSAKWCRRHDVMGSPDDWCANWPELSTRRELMQLMRQDKHLRMTVFSEFSRMQLITKIPDRKIASHVLHIYARHAQAELQALEERIGLRILKELMGAYKDVYRNLTSMLGGNPNVPVPPTKGRRAQFAVVRERKQDD